MDLMSSALPLPRPSPGGPLPPGGTADILNVCDGELFPENGDQVPSPELTFRKQNGDSVKIQFRRTLELCVNYELGFDFFKVVLIDKVVLGSPGPLGNSLK